MPELVEPVDVVRLHVVPRDDQHVIHQLALVEVFQHGESVRPDDRQERVCGPVEHLNRRHMRLEIPMVDQLLDGFGISHEGAWHPLIPQVVGVTNAVRAVQRAPLYVVQAETALAVLHGVAGTFGQLVDLLPAQQGDTGLRLVLSRSSGEGRGSASS